MSLLFGSLGPVIIILAIFSYVYILRIKRIKRYHIKGIGSPLLISVNIDIKANKRKHKKEEKMIRLEPRLLLAIAYTTSCVYSVAVENVYEIWFVQTHALIQKNLSDGSCLVINVCHRGPYLPQSTSNGNLGVQSFAERCPYQNY